MQNLVTWAISVQNQNVFFHQLTHFKDHAWRQKSGPKMILVPSETRDLLRKMRKKSPYFAIICSELLSNHKVVDETTPGVLRDSLAMFEPILVHHFLVQRKLGSEKGWPLIAYSWPP